MPAFFAGGDNAFAAEYMDFTFQAFRANRISVKNG